MASIAQPNTAYQLYSTGLDSTVVSRQQWIAHQHQSIEGPPIDDPRVYASGGPYSYGDQPSLVINTPAPFVLDSHAIPSPLDAYTTLDMGMTAHPQPISTMTFSPRHRPRPSGILFGPIPQFPSSDDSPTQSFTPVQAADSPDLNCVEFEQLSPDEQEAYRRGASEIFAVLRQRQEKPTREAIALPPESVALVVSSPFQSDITDQSLEARDADPHVTSFVDFYDVDIQMEDASLEPQHDRINFVGFGQAALPCFEHKPHTELVSPHNSHPTSLLIAQAYEGGPSARHHSSLPNLHIPPNGSGSLHHPPSAEAWSPDMNRTFVPPTSAANDTSAPSGHPRPFTAGATSPYGISFVHEENHTTVTSSEHPPIRPVTAPGAFSFEFKIPGPEQTDNLESAVPQDAAALKSQTPPIPATSSLKPNTSSFVIRTPLSPRTSQNKPWPMQHPRRRRQQYSTSSKPPAEQTDGAEPKKPRGRKAKAEVAEGSKPRGRKPKAKSEEANVDGNEGAADKDGKAPPRPVINAPKKPLSAWQLYFQKWVHDRMGSTHVYDGKPADRMSVHREAKLASAAYNELSTEEIDKWEELAKEEKKNYEKAYKEWQKKLRPDVIQAENRFRAHSRRHGLNGQKYSRSNMKDPNQPPKPLSAFFLFQKEIQNDPELSKKYFGDLQDAKERAKAAANGWRGLTPEQKRPYLEKAARDKAEWDETQAVYLEMTEHLPSGVDLPPYPTIEEAREYMRQKSARISLSARPQARSAQTQDPTKATA